MTTDNPRGARPGPRGAASERFNPKEWRDFAATLTAVVDLAVKSHRQEREREHAPEQDDAAMRFIFAPMAAGTHVAPPLPSRRFPLSDANETMTFWVEESADGENLLIHLNALDLETADRLADRWATVTIGQQFLSLSVQFDDQGQTAFDVPNLPDCREALRKPFEIDVPGVRFSFRPSEATPDDPTR